MNPQNQTVFDGKTGDCNNAAVATITGLPLCDFPNCDGDGYYPAVLEYLEQHGWMFIEVQMNFYFIFRALQGVPLILSVPSKNYEGKQHAVVACVEGGSWKLLHDPNPNNEPYDLGKTKITEYSLVLRIEGLPAR